MKYKLQVGSLNAVERERKVISLTSEEKTQIKGIQSLVLRNVNCNSRYAQLCIS